MGQLEQRLNKLETGTGAGAKSRTLTNSEAEFILFSSNHMKPESEWITRADLNDSDFLDETGVFPWRREGSADGIEIHCFPFG